MRNYFYQAAAVMLLAAPAYAQDYYGGISTTGLYAETEGLEESEDLQDSGIIGRGQAGARWRGKTSESRVEVSSDYFAFFDRRDRWSNGIEAAHQRNLSERMTVDFLASATTNVATLEFRSADQIVGRGRLTFRPSKADRFRAAAAYRHRSYDNALSSEGSAPYVEADYRRRLGRYNYIDASVRKEWTDSENDFFDYQRLSLAGYYTHPLARRSRIRIGVESRRWEYDARFVPGSAERRRVNHFIPQVRVVHAIADSAELELDYRRYFRESNDDRFDPDGNRFAATLRLTF